MFSMILLLLLVAASVRKINKTANFIALNVYAQIASRFACCLSPYRISENAGEANDAGTECLAQDNRLSCFGRTKDDYFTTSHLPIFPLPSLDSSPSSWQSAQISLGVLRSIVKFSLLKAWNEIDSNFVFISFPVWLCLCVRVSVLACVCVVITIVTTFGASVMSAKSCTRNYFNLPSWLYQTTIRSKTMQSFRLMWPTNILI